MKRLIKFVVTASVVAMSSATMAVPVVFSGQDSAGPNQARPNADAAAAAFTAATLGASTITFESNTVGVYSGPLTLATGVTYTAQNADEYAGIFGTNAQALGYNTTAGGSKELRYSSGSSTANTATFNFASGIDSFGAYFTGVENFNGSATLSFNDGTQQAFTLAGITGGGVQYFGFTDLGKSIKSVSLNGNTADVFGIDDVRYRATTAVPEPASWAMMVGGFGLIGGALRRRKVNVSFA